MPYYHVYVHYTKENQETVHYGEDIDYDRKHINKLVSTIKKEDSFLLKGIRIEPFNITKFEIWKTEGRAHGKPNTWDWISFYGEIVTKDFINTLPTKPLIKLDKTSANSLKEIEHVLSKNVFIVHGRDHRLIEELKAILTELGLIPRVLHELPSGSMTIIEKLEKYSKDIGFAFAILTPDDVGFELNRFKSLLKTATFEFNHEEYFLEETIKHELKPRTRQNVLLEFGFLIGKLSRSKVCCLYKGNVELPSDMHGIVYIHFEESVNEVKDKIVKELKAAGYKIEV